MSAVVLFPVIVRLFHCFGFIGRCYGDLVLSFMVLRFLPSFPIITVMVSVVCGLVLVVCGSSIVFIHSSARCMAPLSSR